MTDEQICAAETLVELQERLQKAMFELLQNSPSVPHTGQVEHQIGEMIAKQISQLSSDDPRRKLQFEIVPHDKEDRDARQSPAIRISGPREIMERLFDPAELEPKRINISIWVEK